MTAYATWDDLALVFDSDAPAEDSNRRNRLTALLQTATDELIAESGGRDYFKHPDSDTETWYADGEGRRALHQHGGIVSLATLALSFDDGATYTDLASSDYVLLGDDARSSAPVPDGEPYFHVRLLPTSAYGVFPAGFRTVKLTGVRGWPAIPTPLVEATVERARQLAYADPSYAGSVIGDPQYGSPVTYDRWPQELYYFLARERRRFQACWL